MRKLYRLLFFLLLLLKQAFVFATNIIQILDLKRKSLTATITASANLSSLVVCCFVVTFPLAFVLLGLLISSHLSPHTYIFPSKDVVVDSSSLNYSFFNSQNLSITTAGRLGNQMFQYAALYGIATANGFKPVLQGGGVLTQAFGGLRCVVENDGGAMEELRSRSLTFVERKSNAFDAHSFSLNFQRPIALLGFFQSWRYFDHVRSDVRKQLASFKHVKPVQQFLQQTIAENNSSLVTLVGVHVRRGDFVGGWKEGYSSPDKYYFRRAMQVFSRKHSSLIFVVCSDDIQWCRSNIHHNKHPVVFSPFSSSSHPPHLDLALLSFCHHSIISGGSFGWWAAWLADGVSVYPHSFPTPFSPLASRFKHSDYFLPQWLSV